MEGSVEWLGKDICHILPRGYVVSMDGVAFFV